MNKETPKKVPFMKTPVLYPVLFMVVLSLFLTGSLATLNYITGPQIAQQKALKEQRAILELLQQSLGDDLVPSDVSKIPPDKVQSLYASYVEKRYSNSIKSDYYVGVKEGSPIGYVFIVNGKGLWGTMTGLIGIDPSGSRLLGLTFLNHQETPGLGGRIEEPWFKAQFRGLAIPTADGDAIVYRTAGVGNVDAITGATLTSNAVSTMYNDAINEVKRVMKEGLE